MLSIIQIENIEKRKHSTNRTTIRDGLSLIYRDMDALRQEATLSPNLARLSHIAKGLEDRLVELKRRDTFLRP